MADFKVLPTVNGVPVSLNTHNHDAIYTAINTAVLLTGNQTVAGVKTLTDALFISVAAGSNPSMRMTDADVAHGITLFGRTTDTILDIAAYSSTEGGALVWAMSDDGATPAFAFWGVIGVTGPTIAPVIFSAGKKNGATVQALSATEKAFSFLNSAAGGVEGAELLTILGSGNVGIGGSPRGKLDAAQVSTTAAIPTLVLEQADLSEDFIDFITTVGTGNPVDTAVPGTYYARIRIAVNGSFKYIPIYNA